MKLLFKIADTSNPLDLAIAIATEGRPALPFCHVEVQFDDGRCFSARLTEGVRWVESIDAREGWVVVDVPWQDTPELRAYCDGMVGQHYDLLAARLSALGLDFGFLPNHPYCSRCAGLVGRKAGDDPPGDASPNGLYRWCQRKGYTAIR